MTNSTKAAFALITAAGLVVPFENELVVIEMFYLLIPLAAIFAGSLIFLLVILITKSANIKTALLITAVIPVFVGSQLLSVVIVSAVQKIRSEALIREIETKAREGKSIPDDYDIPVGIRLVKGTDSQDYKISYSRGFMITEKYDSNSKRWRTYGWND